MLQRLWVEWLRVGDVTETARKERVPAGGIYRFEDDSGTGPELPVSELEELQQLVRWQVLGHLSGEEPSEGFIRLCRHVLNGVARCRLQPAIAAGVGHLVVAVHAAENRGVDLQSCSNLFPGAPELVFGRDVLV